MPFDPIGFLFPKPNIPKGGYGYTGFTEIFSSTGLNLITEGDYFKAEESPSPFKLSTEKRYKVVWNGVEYERGVIEVPIFIDRPSYGIGNQHLWISEAIDTGEPFLIIVAPVYVEAEDYFTTSLIFYTTDSTATVSISEETDHLIDPKYLTLKIDLLEYGIDPFEMFFAGETERTFEMAEVLFALVNANLGNDITLVLRSADGSLVVETKASKSIANGELANLSAYAPLLYDNAYAIGLFINKNGTVLLNAKEM